MISQEKSYISTPLQKLHKNVRDLGKLIVAKGFEKLPKVQKIAQSGHTDYELRYFCTNWYLSLLVLKHFPLLEIKPWFIMTKSVLDRSGVQPPLTFRLYNIKQARAFPGIKIMKQY